MCVAIGATLGASFAICISTMGAITGLCVAMAALGASFVSTLGGCFGIGELEIGAGFAIGAAEIGRNVGLALGVEIGFGVGLGFGLRLGRGLGLGVGFRGSSFGIAIGFASDATGIAFEAGAALVMRGISIDAVPLAIGLGSADVGFRSGTFFVARALATSGEATAASILWTRSVGSDSSKSTSFINAENSDPVEHVKHKRFIIKFVRAPAIAQSAERDWLLESVVTASREVWRVASGSGATSRTPGRHPASGR